MAAVLFGPSSADRDCPGAHAVKADASTVPFRSITEFVARIKGPRPRFQQRHTAILNGLQHIPPDRGKRVASDGGEAVVDEQLGAIDKICIIAGQIKGRAGDVFGLAKAALRGFDGRF